MNLNLVVIPLSKMSDLPGSRSASDITLLPTLVQHLNMFLPAKHHTRSAKSLYLLFTLFLMKLNLLHWCEKPCKAWTKIQARYGGAPGTELVWATCVFHYFSHSLTRTHACFEHAASSASPRSLHVSVLENVKKSARFLELLKPFTPAETNTTGLQFLKEVKNPRS